MRLRFYRVDLTASSDALQDALRLNPQATLGHTPDEPPEVGYLAFEATRAEHDAFEAAHPEVVFTEDLS